MSAYVSLETEVPQLIPPNKWTNLQFEVENSDADGWHIGTSGLITPEITAYGMLLAMVEWDDMGFTVEGFRNGTQTAVQFARDPFGTLNTTATQDHANSGGKDYQTNTWAMLIRPTQSLAVRVWTDAPGGRTVSLAEFKVWVP